MSIPVKSPEEFLRRYQLKEQPNNLFSNLISKIKPLIPDAPATLKKNGVIYKVKKILMNIVATVIFFLNYRKRFIDIALVYDKVKMGSSLNEQFNFLLRRNAGVIRDFELLFFEHKDRIEQPADLAFNELEKAKSQGVAGIGVVWFPALISAGKLLVVSLITYLFMKPKYQEMNLKQSVMEYDLETMKTAEDMKSKGVDEREIIAYMDNRKVGIDRNLVTDMQAKKAGKGFIGKLTAITKTAVKGGGMVLIGGAVALGLIFLLPMLKKRK